MTGEIDQGRTVSAGRPVLKEEPIERLREMGRALGNDVPRRILELYLGDSPARLATMRQALADRDSPALERAAHALKGSSANLGAIDLAELCQRLERLSGDPSGAIAGFGTLEAEYERVEQAMRKVLVEFM